MESTIRLRTLGSLQVHDASGQEAAGLLTQPRRLALLVYLVLALPRGFQRRDRVLSLFWPDHDESQARNALNQALHFLRRALGAESIVSRGDGEIGIDHVWCDVTAFDAALGEGRLDEALDLYRGPFLDGFHITAAAELDAWIEGERSRLARQYRQVLDKMATAREAVSDYSGAMVWLRKLAASDPLATGPALRLMRAMAAAGDPTGALQQARVHESLLREELGAPLDPAIVAFVRQLQSLPHATRVQAAAPAAAVSASAPPHEIPSLPSRRSRWLARLTIAAGLLAAVWVGGLTLTRRRAGAAVPPIRCLAVLPLENLSRDSSREYFADGITDAIITELARHERLDVISHASTMRYKRSAMSMRAIGRELGCDGVLEGTISMLGQRVHVNVQLLFAPDDRHLWARGYDGDLSDALSLERRIADSIASQIHVITTPRLGAVASKVDTITYGLYLRGRDALRSRNPASLHRAVVFFKQAIARDSTFAPGYAGLADTYRMLGGGAFAPIPYGSDSAYVAAVRALALDSTSSEVHTSLAAILTDRADWPHAEAEFKRAIALEPGNSLAHHWYAVMLTTVDRKDEAVREIRRAAELDPLSQPIHGSVLDIERFAGLRQQPAQVAAARSLTDPTHPGLRAFRSVRLAQTGHCPEAYVENKEAQALAPDNTQMLLSLVSVYSFCKENAKARALLDTVERRPDARLSGVFVAAYFASTRQRDSAFAWLERAEWGMQSRYQLRLLPALAPLRSDARYRKLLAGMGLR